MPQTEITISLCMIVKNEESNIERCLDSAHNLVDEINIVDTGSTDRTKEIVKKYTDRIFDYAWNDDFASARNYAFSQATKDYILWLDADDELLEQDQKEFLTLKKTLDPVVDAVNMPYHLILDKHGKPICSLRRNRLVRRSMNFQWIGLVHEYLEVNGKVLISDCAVTHRGGPGELDRNLKIYESRLARGEVLSPRDLYYYANELIDHKMYNRAIEYYLKFLATGKGWVEDNISACGRLADCFEILHEQGNMFKYCFKSFEYDTPRAEFCCRLGFYFLQLEALDQAVFWYKLATEVELPIDSWGQVNYDCWTWLPHLQLCVCYDKLGKHELAYKHNELALKYRPEDSHILHNKRYLEGVLGLESEG
ncbi:MULTISPECIES: glycosyltransferase family 2 protein [Desulfosporosinus]|uniref:SPBc2 prophage-derived glycosyltransferase SunS n=1 Tax=Desulfosporosinus acididurans TaxID=476652 RepID=A0A0J1FKR9_9FIRM|nr:MULTISPECIES: glycosyltransferase family 2 protein [Desulfosporosinus]KLU63992.1 SPBc2 prophage-derived glycosyltransferase SunS [Desulfosporosinus acididurans]